MMRSAALIVIFNCFSDSNTTRSSRLSVSRSSKSMISPTGPHWYLAMAAWSFSPIIRFCAANCAT
eukprot:9898845-Prorocentrum_lima.AAC.1